MRESNFSCINRKFLNFTLCINNIILKLSDELIEVNKNKLEFD